MASDAPSGTPLSIAYLGPAGTFTEQAVFTQSDLAAADHRLMGSIPEVLEATTAGTVDLGFAPIENSIEGSVTATLDALAFERDLLIQREVVIPIHMTLMARPGVALTDLTEVRSISVAAAQCRHYLTEHLPTVPLELTRSTADAARQVAASDDAIGAIAPARAAEVYGLDVLADDLEDHAGNKTRFVVLARDGVPAPTGHDKTSILVYQRDDVPGSLLSILQEFATRGINLNKLESRPTKHALGDYCFLIDLAGHIADELVADCLRDLRFKQGGVKFLGSYPAASEYAESDQTFATAAYHEATDWIARLRDRIR